MPQGLLVELRAALGPTQVLDNAELLAPFCTDWTRRYTGNAICVVRPATTAEVSEIVKTANRFGVGVTTQGGNTGLVGGAVPQESILLSTRRLNWIGPVNVAYREVSVGSGVTLQALQIAAAAAGLRFGVDLAARGSATVGGGIATNAGGVAVIRHGMFRNQVVGVEMVDGRGQIVGQLDRLPKDNTGYDIARLMCGSEGTLGVITAARLRLVEVDPAVLSIGVGLSSVESALALTLAIRAFGLVLDAAEMVMNSGLQLVSALQGTPIPSQLDAPVIAFFDIAGSSDDLLLAEFSRFVAAQSAEVQRDLESVIVASKTSDRSKLWRWRELQAEAIAHVGVPVKLDVSVPLSRIGEFAQSCGGLLDQQSWQASTPRLEIFGHIGDGNLHVNVIAMSAPWSAAEMLLIEEVVLGYVLSLGGSVSAEHGIGRTKRVWLPLQRGSHEVALMKSIKGAFDPGGILNPGVLFQG